MMAIFLVLALVAVYFPSGFGVSLLSFSFSLVRGRCCQVVFHRAVSLATTMMCSPDADRRRFCFRRMMMELSVFPFISLSTDFLRNTGGS